MTKHWNQVDQAVLESQAKAAKDAQKVNRRVCDTLSNLCEFLQVPLVASKERVVRELQNSRSFIAFRPHWKVPHPVFLLDVVHAPENELGHRVQISVSS